MSCLNIYWKMNNRHKLLMQLNQPEESSLKAVPNRVINQRGFHVIEGEKYLLRWLCLQSFLCQLLSTGTKALANYWKEWSMEVNFRERERGYNWSSFYSFCHCSYSARSTFGDRIAKIIRRLNISTAKMSTAIPCCTCRQEKWSHCSYQVATLCSFAIWGAAYLYLNRKSW